MPQFDDLISDLLRENLLDDSIASANFKKVSSEFDAATFSNSQNQNSVQYKNFQDDAYNYELEIPDSAYILNDNKFVLQNYVEDFSIVHLSLDTTDESLTDPPNSLISTQSSALTSQKLIKSSRKKSKKKIKLNGKYCPNCKLRLSHIHLYCQFCQNRILGNLYYYPIIFGSLFLFITAIGLFVMLRYPS